jgi:hypothetical protein
MRKRHHTPEEIETITREIQQRYGLVARLGGFSRRLDNHSAFRRLPDDLSTLLKMSRQGDVDATYKLYWRARIELTILMARSDTGVPVQIFEVCHDLVRAAEKMTDPRQGGDERRNLDRDWRIIQAVNWICEQGFGPTQNDTTEGNQSASYIVAEALRRLGIAVSGGAVQGVWKRRRKIEKAIKRPAADALKATGQPQRLSP